MRVNPFYTLQIGNIFRCINKCEVTVLPKPTSLTMKESNMSAKDIYTVYVTINLINNKSYIGVHKTTNPNDDYLGSGLNLQRAIKKYGKENFKKEILFEFSSIDEAYNKEAELVNEEFIKREDVYNIKLGGMGGLGGYSHTLKTKNKISIKNKGRKIPFDSIQKMIKSKEKYVVIDDAIYKSAKIASSILNISYGKIYSRLNSFNQYNYVYLNPEDNNDNQKIIINEIEYHTIYHAQKYTSEKSISIHHKVKSKHYPYYYKKLTIKRKIY